MIGLTGRPGKTTTKNLVRDVVAAGFSVVATKANQNNELGVPRTLLAADPETEVVVVEMGMRGLGQIAELCRFVRPDWGLITNVGESHIELLGSRENIARAKAELACSVPSGVGRVFLNADDDYTPFAVEEAKLDERGVECVLFGGSAGGRHGSSRVGARRPPRRGGAPDVHVVRSRVRRRRPRRRRGGGVPSQSSRHAQRFQRLLSGGGRPLARHGRRGDRPCS